MFEDSTFESQGRIHTRSKRWMVAALAFNSSILAALIVFPLIYPSVLPLRSLPFLIATVQPPTAAQTLPHRVSTAASTSVQRNILDPLQVPTRVPTLIDIARDPAPSGPIAMGNGDPRLGEGIPGGFGDNPFQHTTQPAVHQEPKTVRISSGTVDGMNIFRSIPPYPIIARTMHVEGTVVLAATISKAGTIENLRVVSGPVVLQQAALDAVKTWRYRPYMLDGQPVEVETSVDVVFRIGH